MSYAEVLQSFSGHAEVNGPPRIRVAAAFITHDGRYLITRRKEGGYLGGLWEFPGGKCEAGETIEACVCRELREELDIEVIHPVYTMLHTHDYPDRKVELHFFDCSRYRGIPKALDCAEVRWVKPEAFSDFEFLPGDIPVLAKLLEQASSG